MAYRIGNTGLILPIARFSCAFVLILSITACNPPGGVAKPPAPARSLLPETPFVGDETEVRDPPPVAERRVINECSVGCWVLPEEAKLRFPVELRPSARLSFRMSALTRIPVHIGDLTIKVEYVPGEAHTSSDGKRIEPGKPVVIYQTTPVDSPDIFRDWCFVDCSLSHLAPGKGEVCFSATGPIAGNPGLDLMFGEPVVYHPDERRHRNVLLIGVDTLRQDSLTPYGASPKVTPNLQKLSDESTLFTQNRSQAPWTLPSFASMITGRLPSEIGATIYTGFLPDRNTTIAEILLPEGYATGTICSNAWLGNEQSGFQQGMEELWYEYNAPADKSVEKAIDFITRSSGKDWFCFLHFIDPHVPYAPGRKYVDLLCDPAYDGPFVEVFNAVEQWKSGTTTPTASDLEQARNLYLGEVARVDDSLETLFEHLRQTGLMDETLVIFAADHGEEFFDHGGFEHGQSQYDELVHTPLIIRGPGFAKGRRMDSNVGNIDIFPTILSYLEMPIPDNVVGTPLQQVATGEISNDRMIFGEDNSRGTLRKFAVQWPYKCILDFVTGESRLYDLEKNPKETEDLGAEDKATTRQMSERIAGAMIPEQTGLHIWITRSYNEAPQTFTGTLRVPGGIERVVAFRLLGGDSYEVKDDTITFSITSSLELLGPNKHLLIIPAKGADTLEASILVGGQVRPDRFFPYGIDRPEPSCAATVNIRDFPLGPELPLSIEENPAGCYIWGVRGFDSESDRVTLDQETKDQLRSLGYLGD